LAVFLVIPAGCGQHTSDVSIFRMTASGFGPGPAGTDSGSVEVTAEFRNTGKQPAKLNLRNLVGGAMPSSVNKALGKPVEESRTTRVWFVAVRVRDQTRGEWGGFFLAGEYRVNGRPINPWIEGIIEMAPGRTATFSVPLAFGRLKGVNAPRPKQVCVIIEDLQGTKVAEKTITL
jgi:hypothetical protein